MPASCLVPRVRRESTSMVARVLLPLCALAALLFSPVAHAQEPDERVERARALFEQAEAAMTAQQFAAAAEGYRQSYELLREAGRATAPLVLYNSGLAWERGGERERALEAYRRFLDEATGQDEETRRRVVDAQARVTALEPAAPTPAPTPVAPPPEAAASAPEAAPVAERSSGGGGISPVGPILMGAGGALFVTGMILGGVALGRDGDFEAMCPGRTGCDPSLRAQWDETRTLALAGDVLWIGGAVVAATGLVLTFVLTEGGESDASAALACGLGECAVRGTF